MRFKLIFLIFLTSLNAEIILVTNRFSDFNTLSVESIKYLYLGKVNSIDNIKITPLVSKDKLVHKKFVNKIINKTIYQYDSYWARLVFTGRKAIPKRLSKEQIEEELDKPNTLIYIKKEHYNTNWKIIYEDH